MRHSDLAIGGIPKKCTPTWERVELHDRTITVLAFRLRCKIPEFIHNVVCELKSRLVFRKVVILTNI